MSFPEKINSTLSSYFSQRGYLTSFKEFNVISNWKEIVGDEIADNSNCICVENKILYISIKSSSWRQEISYLKKDIIDKINTISQIFLIEDIVFL